MRAEATTEVSSSWERHPLLVTGLRRLSAISLVLLALLFGTDLALARFGRPDGELSMQVARAALGLAFAVSLLVLALAIRRQRELRRPAALATLVTLLVVLAGALETLATGGVHGYFPGGLLVVLLFWPVLMPGGASTAALAVVGSVALQGAVLVAAGDLGLARVGLLSGALAGVVLGYAQVLERWRRQLSAASRVDWLTGSMSWRAIVGDFEVLCARRSRHWAPLTLVMFDVDRFERINDRHGPAFGDDVLELLESAVRSETRGTDLLGRHRSDEFLLVLDACDSEQAVEILARIRARLASTPLRAGSEEVRITFSAGVVTASRGAPLVAADLLKAAEQALLGSKERQLNQTSLGGAGPVADAKAGAQAALATARVEATAQLGSAARAPEATGALHFSGPPLHASGSSESGAAGPEALDALATGESAEPGLRARAPQASGVPGPEASGEVSAAVPALRASAGQAQGVRAPAVRSEVESAGAAPRAGAPVSPGGLASGSSAALESEVPASRAGAPVWSGVPMAGSNEALESGGSAPLASAALASAALAPVVVDEAAAERAPWADAPLESGGLPLEEAALPASVAIGGAIAALLAPDVVAAPPPGKPERLAPPTLAGSSPPALPSRRLTGATTLAVPKAPTGATVAAQPAPPSLPRQQGTHGSIGPLILPALGPSTTKSGIPTIPPVSSTSAVPPVSAAPATSERLAPGLPPAAVWRFPPAPPRSPTLAPPPPPDDDFEEAQVLESE